VLPARPLLGERIGWVGWMAAVIGFAGVLLIVRPGRGLDPIGVGFVLCRAS
jgi:drug/metabolite transporter (DMT)-like permease